MSSSIKTRGSCLLCLFIVLAFSVSPASSPKAAGPWYVAPGGSDSNTCLSPASACATINATLNKPDFTPGDTVWIASGVYTGDGDVFEEIVTINQEVNMVGGWNQSFSEQNGTTIIDGQHSRPVIRVNADAVVDRISIINGNEVLDVGYTIIVFTGALTLKNSSVYGGEGTGIYVVSGRLILINSSVRDNEGPGIFVESGGDVKVINSTISRNNIGGGISAINSSVSLFNSTIYGNEASFNGGGINSNSPVTLTNTILYGNIATVGPDCSLSETHSLGYNLIGDLTGCSSFVPDPTDKVGIDPRLGELISLPEYPAYYPLLEGSPAIDAGNPTGCTDDQDKLLVTDQRGKPRFSRCDIGAYEMQPLGYSTKEANHQAAIPGEVITYTIMLENPGMEEIPDVQLADNLPGALNYVDGSLVATKGQPTYQDGLISWAGTLSAQEQVSVTFSATVDQLAPIFQPITNTAEIHGGGEIFPRSAIVLITQPYQVFCPLISRP